MYVSQSTGAMTGAKLPVLNVTKQLNWAIMTMIEYMSKLMSWFKKKKLYKVVWKYDSTSGIYYTEIVKAYDVAHAWQLIKGAHATSITLVSIEVQEDI
jgi:hypothetical protein